MQFQVQHTTRYRYSLPVRLERHTLRFRPRCDGTTRLIDYRLRVHPRPFTWSECLDLDGNAIVDVGFDGWTDSLTVISQFSAETLRQNPFDFVLEPWAAMLPLYPIEPLSRAWAPYLEREQPSAAVDQLARVVYAEAGGRTVPFVTMLNRRISETIQATLRLEGHPQLPDVTLSSGVGACRDLAVLFIDACRSVGIATRFVSGYQSPRLPEHTRYLHAWSEVYLPGAGWRGFDSVTGLAVSEGHVAVAAAAAPMSAAPVVGSFRSDGATCSMETEMNIECDSSGAVAANSLA